MSFSRRVPPSLIGPFAWLGKTDWITPTVNGYRRSSDLRAIVDKSQRFGNVFAAEVRGIIHVSLGAQTPNGVWFHDRTPFTDMFFMTSKVLANGQKIVKLSTEWCEQFENTDLSLSFKDYRQPFPTMVIEFPPSHFDANIASNTGHCPEFIAIHHEEQEGLILFQMKSRIQTLLGQLVYEPDQPIEYELDKLNPNSIVDNELKPQRMGFDLKFIKIALNAVVAMTYGTEWQTLGPTRDERQNSKTLKKQVRSKDRKASSKARLLLGILPEYFQFDQKIKAFGESSRDRSDVLDSDGTPKKPHWRRGHWRQQPIGPGRVSREVRWIRPILINAGQFLGDLKDTTTTYVAS